LPDGLWQYTYTITPSTSNKNRGVGSIIIQFGEQPTDLVWNYTYVGGSTSAMGTATTDGTLAGSGTSIPVYTYDSWLNAADPASSRVNVTTTFPGIQWTINTNNPNGSNYVELDLKTALAPIWGNCYMDGYNKTSNNGYGMVRNTNYDIPAPEPFSLDGPVLSGYLPVPGYLVSPEDTTPPNVVSTTPSDSATGVLQGTPVTATFSENVDPESVVANGAFTISGVSGTVTYDAASRTATFTPGVGFSYGTSYYVTVTGVKDLAGNVMESASNWSFSTPSAPDTKPPTVLSVNPVAGAQGVPVNSVITATFSEPMDAATVNATSFTVKGMAGTVIYDTASNSATFRPVTDLSYNSTYTAIVMPGVRDQAGNPMSAAKTWTFTTQLQNVPGDLSGNGLLDVSDALMALRILITPSGAQMTLGDVGPLVNGIPTPDGKIDVSDAVVILRRVVGLANW
jgi:hypothetical protein